MIPLARVTAATLAAAALVIAPVGAAVAATPAAASADRDYGDSVSIPADKVPAVIAARKAYLESASAIKRTYRQAVQKAMDAVSTEVADEALAYELAMDALKVTAWSGADTTAAKAAASAAKDAYQAALTAARDKVRADLDAAKATARSGLDTAKATYEKAITDAFAGTAVPKGLLNPPGGWGKGMHGMGDWGKGWRR